MVTKGSHHRVRVRAMYEAAEPSAAPVAADEVPESEEPTAPLDPVSVGVYGRAGRVTEGRRIEGCTREEICEKYRGRILIIARRVGERLPASCEIETADLAGFGAIGLLEAFDRFDAERKILFSTYAEYRIRGAMMDALRQNDAFSRHRRQMARKVQLASAALLSELGRPARPEEVAARLEVDLATYWSVVDRTRPVSFVSFDAQSAEGDDHSPPLLETLHAGEGQEALQALMGQDARRLLKEAILALPERKRQCVLLYYGRGLSLAEVAAVFDLTSARICQILSAARIDLRAALEGKISVEDLDGMDIAKVESA